MGIIERLAQYEQEVAQEALAVLQGDYPSFYDEATTTVIIQALEEYIAHRAPSLAVAHQPNTATSKE